MATDDESRLFAPADTTHAPRVLVIAEIGVNHDGDVGRADQLLHAAADAGANAIKLQLFRPDRLLSAAARLATYQDGQADDAYALLDALTLPLDHLTDLRATAKALGLQFIVTPFSLDDVADLAALDVDAVKIASPDAVNTPLLDAVATLGKPVIVSTGTCELDELDDAGRIAQATGGGLLQCVSAYPTPDLAAGLGGMAALRDRFPGVAVGYSDHTAALDTGGLAVAAGAVVLEKHLTHDRAAPGPDHAASLEPADFATYVAAVRRAATMLGPQRKTCTPRERDVHQVSRQSVCVVRDLSAGHVLTREDLTVKRPGTGVPARHLNDAIGRRLARPVKADHPLRHEDLANHS
ncbi:MAG: N-acetylneuraminate synthase family protein [Planctomycetota bacterium]